jgi:DNA-binding MarR family transcriptional regulator
VSVPSRAAAAPRNPNVPAADEVAAGLRLSTTRLARRLRTEAEIGLTPSLLSALAVVHVHGPLTLGALAELEGIAPPTVTKIVGKLQDQALVERIGDAADRRVCRVVTTDAGEQLLARSRARKTAWLAARLDGLPERDLVLLARASELIDELLASDRVHPGAAPQDGSP